MHICILLYIHVTVLYYILACSQKNKMLMLMPPLCYYVDVNAPILTAYQSFYSKSNFHPTVLTAYHCHLPPSNLQNLKVLYQYHKNYHFCMHSSFIRIKLKTLYRVLRVSFTQNCNPLTKYAITLTSHLAVH